MLDAFDTYDFSHKKRDDDEDPDSDSDPGDESTRMTTTSHRSLMLHPEDSVTGRPYLLSRKKKGLSEEAAAAAAATLNKEPQQFPSDQHRLSTASRMRGLRGRLIKTKSD